MSLCQICLENVPSFGCEKCGCFQCWDCLKINKFLCCGCPFEINKYKLLFENFDFELYEKIKIYVDEKFDKFNADHGDKILSMKKHHFSLIYHSEDSMADLELDIDECFKRLMIAHIDEKPDEFFEHFLNLKNSVGTTGIHVETVSDPKTFENENYFTNFFSMLNYYTSGRFLWAKLKSEKIKDCCKCRFLNCKKCNDGLYCPDCLMNLEKTRVHDCNVSEPDDILKELKMCPSCSIIVEKREGCDDMWCMNCKSFFSWRQGIIRRDTPHNPDHRDFGENYFEERMFSEMLDVNNGICNETNFMIDYVCKKAYYEKALYENASKFVDPPSKHLIPKFLQEIMIHEIIKLKDYSERSVYTITKIYDIFKNYKNIIIRICGRREFYSKYDYVEDYNSFSLKISANRILYARFENELVDF